MSKLIVEVCEISEIKVHSNSDNLELAVIKGFQCVVRKNTFRTGDKIVFFPPDTLLTKELAESFGVTNYLQWKSDGFGRTRTVRLRGEPSFGLAVPVPDVSWEVGRDVVEHYGVRKYEPPVRETSADVGRDIPEFHKYTSIENLRHFPDLFVEGEEVIATEKAHGSNFRMAVIDGNTLVAGSHQLRRKIPCVSNVEQTKLSPSHFWNSIEYDHDGNHSQYYVDGDILRTNRYWFPARNIGVIDLLRTASIRFNAQNVIVFGEVFGANIQKPFYYGSPNEMQFRVFDISVDGQYLDYDEFKAVCDEFGVPTCPVLYRGPYNFEILKKYINGPTAIADCNQIREGIVIRPVVERTHPKVGRIVAKFIGDDYLMAKESGKVTDYTEE